MKIPEFLRDEPLYGSRPGKFEGNRSARLAAAVSSSNFFYEEVKIGEDESFFLLPRVASRTGRMPGGGWIIHFDPQGFVAVESFLVPDHEKMMARWEELEHESEDY